MRFVFDIQDEQSILEEMSRNWNKAKSMEQACIQQGKAKQAARWMASARQVSIKIMLLERVFQRKN